MTQGEGHQVWNDRKCCAINLRFTRLRSASLMQDLYGSMSEVLALPGLLPPFRHRRHAIKSTRSDSP